MKYAVIQTTNHPFRAYNVQTDRIYFHTVPSATWKGMEEKTDYYIFLIAYEKSTFYEKTPTNVLQMLRVENVQVIGYKQDILMYFTNKRPKYEEMRFSWIENDKNEVHIEYFDDEESMKLYLELTID